jgi:hypothetical protein
MIPSTTNKLLVAEDWKKLYQSFRNADFKSYDFETLRRTMISYLRENYPEDFNDFVESSEYVALIDLIAYLGQNLSFRIDLNARENFLETAERRESVLRLARLINYNAKRNVPSTGFLKILSVSTTDNVFDDNGINLSNGTISWNDPTNNNWYQQFVNVLSSSMPGDFVFGKPYNKAIISGVETQQYRIASNNTDVPIYGFTGNIGGTSMNFEIVSTAFDSDGILYEEPPLPANQFSFLYKNDNQGNSSANTGFFVHFRQGAIAASSFTIDNPSENTLIGINAPDINNSDVWLWQLGNNGTHQTLWTKVSDLVGNNIIYNSLNNSIRTIFSVLTRENDQIDLSFADGSFGDLPKGQFKLYYRQSNGLGYVIRPEQLSNIGVNIPYRNKQGQVHTLSLTMSLQTMVNNSLTSETNDNIKKNAPQNFYVQNRMVTAEDYNIAPLAVSSDILKIKSLNRVSSGISKYYDLSDVSGRYSSTNIFADDGVLYSQEQEYNFEFNFINANDILGTIRNRLGPIISSEDMKNYYMDKYPRIESLSEHYKWKQAQKLTNESKGFFTNYAGPSNVGEFAGNTLKNLSPGALVKFAPPDGKYFLPDGSATTSQDANTRTYRWSKVVKIIGDGSNTGQGLLDDGQGPITLTGNVVSNSVPLEVIPRFASVISVGIESEITNICLSKRNLGLAFDSLTRQWYIITDTNLDLTSPFSLSYQKDVTNIGKDSSWLVAFEWTGRNYKVRYRVLEYIFESEEQTSFFVDANKKNFDFVNNVLVKDRIDILAINRVLDPNPTVLVALSTATVANTLITKTIGSTVSTGTTIVLSNKDGIIRNNSIAIHPKFVNGYGLITNISTNTNAVTISSGVFSSISIGETVTISLSNVPVQVEKEYKYYESSVDQFVTLGKDIQWQIDSAVVETDGYVDPKKIKVSFLDSDDDGQIDDPDSFTIIASPDSLSAQTGYKDKFIYFKITTDGQRYTLVADGTIIAYPSPAEVLYTPTDGQLFYFYNKDIDVVKQWSTIEQDFVLAPDYTAKPGRRHIKFHYLHNSGQERRLDPSKTNIVEIYLLTKSYDTEFRSWLSTRVGDEPLPPTSQALEENFMLGLESIKSISDEIIFQPTQYKILFGNLAAAELQATFKAVRNSTRTTSDNDLKTRILTSINEFFSIENWEFGQTFNFSELSAYVMNELTPDITNFVVVPKVNKSFGALYEITAQSNEIFINGATVNDIEIISALTASELKTNTSIVSNTVGS